MRNLSVVALILLVSSPVLAMGRKPAPQFAYDPLELTCRNAQGQTGLNAQTVGACADMGGWMITSASASVRRKLSKPGLDLSGANLVGAVIGGISWDGTKLLHANLSQARFVSGQYANLRLNGADLSGADLAILHDGVADWRGSVFDDHTTLPFAHGLAIPQGMVYRQAIVADGKPAVKVDGVELKGVQCDILSGLGEVTYVIDDGMPREVGVEYISGQEFTVKTGDGVCPLLMLQDLIFAMTGRKVGLTLQDGVLTAIDELP